MENIRQFISQIVSGDNIAAKETFNELVSERSMEALAIRKQEIAQKLFQTEAKKEENQTDEDDECSMKEEVK